MPSCLGRIISLIKKRGSLLWVIAFDWNNDDILTLSNMISSDDECNHWILDAATNLAKKLLAGISQVWMGSPPNCA